MTPEERAILCVSYVRSVAHRDEYKLADWQVSDWEYEIARHIRISQREAAEAMREACAREVNEWKSVILENSSDVDAQTIQMMLDNQRKSHVEVIRALTWPLT